MKPKNTHPDEVSVHSILSDIKDRRRDPSTLNKEVRQQCVEVLFLEGQLPSGIAVLLQVSDKTIQRDIKEIREKNALTPNVELGKQLVGEFLLNMRAHHAYLMRLARTKDASVQEKVYAETAAAQVSSDMMRLLQSLGFLPERPKQVVGDFFHHSQEEEKTLAELKKQITETEDVLKASNTSSPEALKKLQALKLRLEKNQIENEVLQIKENIEEKETHDEHPNT